MRIIVCEEPGVEEGYKAYCIDCESLTGCMDYPQHVWRQPLEKCKVVKILDRTTLLEESPGYKILEDLVKKEGGNASKDSRTFTAALEEIVRAAFSARMTHQHQLKQTPY